MKIFFTIIILLTGFFCNAQDDYSNKKIIDLDENILKQEVKHNVIYASNNVEYHFNDLGVLQDSALMILKNSQFFPNSFTIDYDLDSFSTKFISIIRKIDRLPLDDKQLLQEYESIHNSLSKLDNTRDLQYAILHFENQSKKIIDTSIKTKVRLLTIDIRKIFDPNYSMAVAEYVKKSNLPLALYLYMGKFLHYDSLKDYRNTAYINYRIGVIYCGRKNLPFLKSSINHLASAADEYFLLGDSLNFIRSAMAQASAINSILTEPQSFYSEDIIAETHNLFSGNSAAIVVFEKNRNFFRAKILSCLLISATMLRNKHEKNMFYINLGDYFSNCSEVDSNRTFALACYNAALFESTIPDDYYEALIKLANFYNQSKNYKKSNNLIDCAMEIARKQNNGNLILPKLCIIKGVFFKNELMYGESIASIKEGLFYLEQPWYENVYRENLLLIAYGTLIESFQKLQCHDSALIYQDKYLQLRAKLSGEFDRMQEIEINTFKGKTKREFTFFQNIISRANTTAFLTISIGVTITIVLIIVIVLKNKKVKKVRIDLNALAKGKVHNIQNNYSSIYNLIRNKDFDKARKYADASSNFFRLLVDKEDLKTNRWSLENEIEILNAFIVREKARGKRIKLIPPEFGLLDTEKIMFLPEIFTTLFHNSIRHGITDAGKELILKIEVQKVKNNLLFRVSDNGKPSALEAYIKEAKPHKGLCVLRNRILNEFKPGFKMFMPSDIFVIEPIENVGTTIKFLFPYATIKNTNRRGQHRRFRIIDRFDFRQRF